MKVVSEFFLSLPTNESHSCHHTGIVAGHAQKVHRLILHKIEELLLDGVTNANEIQRIPKVMDLVTSECQIS